MAISTGLAANWLTRLAKKWMKIQRERGSEIDDIVNTFGGNPESLCRRYIEPECQKENPADHHENEPVRAFKRPIREYVSDFLAGEFFAADGRNVVFILGDAGMGKTSLLIMLKLTHMARFWPGELDFMLLKLGPDTLDKLTAASNKGNTFLLLDSLDEDPAAMKHVEARLLELLDACKGFRQVFLTCRTQFFPKGHIEGVGKIEVGSYLCNLVFLSLFSDQQVEAYLKKAFPNQWFHYLAKPFRRKDNQRLEAARATVKPMQSLKMRPLLLSYIDELEEADTASGNVFVIYKALTDRWLRREERKLQKLQGRRAPTEEQLLRAAEIVAIELQASGKREMAADEMEALFGSQPKAKEVTAIEASGRSLLNKKADGSYRFAHYSIQEFLVVHCLVTDVNTYHKQMLQATEEIWGFIRAWLVDQRAGVREILRKIPGRADLCGANLTDANLTDTNLGAANLARANLARANLTIAKLSGADLTETNLNGADLSGADLSGADLSGADLGGAYLRGANLTDAIGLVKEQLARAIIDERTILPTHVPYRAKLLEISAKIRTRMQS